MTIKDKGLRVRVPYLARNIKNLNKMITVYGITENGIHTDVSKTLRGAKIYATKNGFNQVSKRIGYNATIVASRINGTWESHPLPF